MSKVVIVGAGFSGLYLAMKLHQSGFKVSVYDPLPNTHIDFKNLNQKNRHQLSAERAFTEDKERTLYEEIVFLNISIETKRFINFSNDSSFTGIIVVDDEGREELVECDVVFDCTGAQRALINDINKIIIPSPFKIKPIISESNAKNQLLISVKMSTPDYQQLITASKKLKKTIPSPIDYVKSIEQLREFDWKELGYPSVHIVNFKEDIVSLYLEAPDALPEHQYSAWLQVVINAITHSDTITFQQVANSTKYPKKSHFNLYAAEPRMVEPVAYQNNHFPTVIPIGDALIESNYVISDDLSLEMQRIDLLMEQIDASSEILPFNTDNYSDLIKKSILEHQTSMIDYHQTRQANFLQSLLQSQSYYIQAIEHFVHADKTVKQLTKTLNEITARIDHQKIQEKCAELYGTDGKISINEIITSMDRQKHQESSAGVYGADGKISIHTISSNQLDAQLTSLYHTIVLVLEKLPSFSKERALNLHHLKAIAVAWRDLGSRFFKEGLPAKALQKYQQSLDIYQHPSLLNVYSLQELTLHSLIISCKFELNKTNYIIKKVPEILSKYQHTPKSLLIRKQLLLNFIAWFDSLETAPNSLKESVSVMITEHAELLNESPNNKTKALKEIGLFQFKNVKDPYSDTDALSTQTQNSFD